MVRERDIEMFFKFSVGEREKDSVRTGLATFGFELQWSRLNVISMFLE